MEHIGRTAWKKLLSNGANEFPQLVLLAGSLTKLPQKPSSLLDAACMPAPVTKRKMRKIHPNRSASVHAVRFRVQSAVEKIKERTGTMKRAERAKLTRVGRWLTRLVPVHVVASFTLRTRSVSQVDSSYRRLVPRSLQAQTSVLR
jgi:hypothetical protein